VSDRRTRREDPRPLTAAPVARLAADRSDRDYVDQPDRFQGVPLDVAFARIFACR